MATSKQVSLANAALTKIGASRINSFDDNKTEAVVVKEFYERSYRNLLAQYPWSWALKVETLALLQHKPKKDFEFAFKLPSDLIWLYRMYPNGNYKIIGDELHTNNKEVTIKYIYRADEEDMPPFFEQAFMYYLASQICIPITENATKDQLLYMQYQDHLKRAKSLEAQQQPQDGFDDLPVHDYRFGG